MAKFKEGNWYLVEFYDHVRGSEEEVKCRIIAQYLGESTTGLSYIFSWWECLDPTCKDDNREFMTILKSTVFRGEPVPRRFLGQ